MGFQRRVWGWDFRWVQRRVQTSEGVQLEGFQTSPHPLEGVQTSPHPQTRRVQTSEPSSICAAVKEVGDFDMSTMTLRPRT